MDGSRPVKWKKFLYISFIAALAFAAVLLVLAHIFMGGTLRKGISIENNDVSWTSSDEAKKIVTEYIQRSYPEKSITLIYQDRSWELEFDDIDYGFRIDEAVEQAFSIGRAGGFFRNLYNSVLLSVNGQNIDVGVEYRKEKIQAVLKKIKKDCDINGKNATISYENGSVKFTKEGNGKSLDIDRNMDLIENQLLKRDFRDIELQVDEIKPYIVYNDIKEIGSILSAFSTRFSTGDANRTDNIKLACSRIDNRILLPGDEFSMNESLGPRTLENGYKEAPIILKNELVAGTGGGVCQVSSTLYNTVLLAGLMITERTNHSIPLTYISPGRDATINEGSIDFRFINNGDYPICLQADVSGGVLSIKILGRKSAEKNTIKIRTEILKTYPPEPEEVTIDSSLRPGEKAVERRAVDGVRVAAYREFYDSGGKLIKSEKLSEDYYKPVQGRVRIGADYNEAIKYLPSP